jgi:hypothetical protein
MEKCIIKHNSSLGAILCSTCRKIIKTGKDFTPDEVAYIRGELETPLPPQYCDSCKLLNKQIK